MQIKKPASLTQLITAGILIFAGSIAMSALVSSYFALFSDSLASSEVNVEIEPSLSLAILDKDPNVSSNVVPIDTISMDVAPTSDGAFITSTAYVAAGSNNETGYTLTFSDGDDDTDLVSSGSSITATIPSIASASSNLTDIELNRWGYAFGDSSTLGSVFNPIPALSTPTTLATTTAEGAEVYSFTVAAKIDTSVTAGTYEDSLIFSLTANYVVPPTTEWEFNYTGGEQTFTVPADGIYKLEVWGAQGGYAYSATSYTGGYGAYSTGNISLKKGHTLYINVGGAGQNGTSKTKGLTVGGYNGGGQAYIYGNKYVGSGGGCTHIANKTGLLQELEASKGDLDPTSSYYVSDTIIIVAGGGGGSSLEASSLYALGGAGGGYIGSNSRKVNYSERRVGYGGTQTGAVNYLENTRDYTPGSFGLGGGSKSDGNGAGAGFYGGSVSNGATGGGGGSGYIANPNLTNKYMTCYSCATSTTEATKTISNTNVSAEPLADYAKQGNGYAKITYLGR